jgi:hypothetical protein
MINKRALPQDIPNEIKIDHSYILSNGSVISPPLKTMNLQLPFISQPFPTYFYSFILQATLALRSWRGGRGRAWWGNYIRDWCSPATTDDVSDSFLQEISGSPT